MTTITTSNDLGTKICEIFGIIPSQVTEIKIYILAGKAPSITFKRCITHPEIGKIVSFLEDYVLEKKIVKKENEVGE